MWLGLTDANGRLYIDAGAPASSDGVVGGIGLTAAGAARVVAALSTIFVNGMMVSNDRRLVVSPGGTIANYSMGLPRTSDGRLVTQADIAPATSDPYVAGIRVGPLGGVYTTSASPPSSFTGFSNGFSNGFGAP